MNDMGSKIAAARKDKGLTQTEFAEKLSVTRQTVSRWEAGTVMPDIDKIPDIASLLDVSCDFLLIDDIKDRESVSPVSVPSLGRLIKSIEGKKVKLHFCDEEADIDLYNKIVTVENFEGNWMKVSAGTAKGGTIEKLIPLSSVLSFEFVKEDN